MSKHLILVGGGHAHMMTLANLDQFIAALRAIAREARENPELLHQAPMKPKVQRLDEATAARKPCLCG